MPVATFSLLWGASCEELALFNCDDVWSVAVPTVVLLWKNTLLAELTFFNCDYASVAPPVGSALNKNQYEVEWM